MLPTLTSVQTLNITTAANILSASTYEVPTLVAAKKALLILVKIHYILDEFVRPNLLVARSVTIMEHATPEVMNKLSANASNGMLEKVVILILKVNKIYGY